MDNDLTQLVIAAERNLIEAESKERFEMFKALMKAIVETAGGRLK